MVESKGKDMFAHTPHQNQKAIGAPAAESDFSQSAIHLANNQIYHSRTKHIDVKLHFVRNIVEYGAIQICKITSEDNLADMLTKPLAKEKFQKCLSKIGFV
ncbi:hypothetical protein VIGAN_10092300 [Vigna angularis var. angularis]|uniref:Reverse transcriptase Ty1/copia-type domain-containing protein n=1 Tax=Vigna angularis var. angularis TaxID=157739 RepID=A0A0S3T374_PHAAN|nr:hypothetical protein VIGAN_10092300 [Vigna angularis var. angularis]